MTVSAPLPESTFDVPLGLDQDVDQGAIVEVAVIKIRRHAALEERASFFDLFGQLVEQRIVLDSPDDLLFVVEREVARDGTSKAARGFFRFNQRHPGAPREEW